MQHILFSLIKKDLRYEGNPKHEPDRLSLFHDEKTSATLQIFDVSRKTQVSEVYSFEEVHRGRKPIDLYLLIILQW